MGIVITTRELILALPLSVSIVDALRVANRNDHNISQTGNIPTDPSWNIFLQNLTPPVLINSRDYFLEVRKNNLHRNSAPSVQIYKLD
jgi:hypothetical protein